MGAAWQSRPQRLALVGDNEKPTPILWHTMVCGVDHL
jgi:hypothetical protein